MKKKKDYTYKLYKFIRENGGWANFTYKVLDNCVDVNCKTHLLKKERMYYDLLKPSLNTLRPYQPLEEKIERIKEYRMKNKERIKQKGEEYRMKNKERINQKGEEYRINNKEKLKEKVKCECGRLVVRRTLNRHKRTKTHLRLMKEK